MCFFTGMDHGVFWTYMERRMPSKRELTVGVGYVTVFLYKKYYFCLNDYKLT